MLISLDGPTGSFGCLLGDAEMHLVVATIHSHTALHWKEGRFTHPWQPALHWLPLPCTELFD